jgi:4'-phosphopantetheinyl transferase
LWPERKLKAALDRLPAALLPAVLRFRDPRERQSRLAARLLLPAGLELLGCDASLEDMRMSPGGKPFLEAHPAHFSFSHAPGLALAALSLSGPVGVDVEIVGALAAEAAGHMLTAEERAHLARVPRPERELARLWTVKEAVLKADGRGLTLDPRRVDAMDPAPCLEGRRWRVASVFLDADGICAVACRNRAKIRMLRAADVIDGFSSGRYEERSFHI